MVPCAGVRIVSSRWCDRCHGKAHAYGERCPARTYTVRAPDPVYAALMAECTVIPGDPCRTCGGPTWAGLFPGFVVTICTACDLQVAVSTSNDKSIQGLT